MPELHERFEGEPKVFAVCCRCSRAKTALCASLPSWRRHLRLYCIAAAVMLRPPLYCVAGAVVLGQRLCLVCFTAFVAKAPPLHCVATTLVLKTAPFLSWSLGLRALALAQAD